MTPESRKQGSAAGGIRLLLILGTVALLAVLGWRLLGRGTPAPAGSGMAGMPGMTQESDTGMASMDMASDGSVRLTGDQIREFGVTFDTAGLRTISTTVRTVGVVTPDETRITQVAPKFDGVVEKLYASVTGQYIRRGQPLLEIYSPALVSAQEELLSARRLDAQLGQDEVPGMPAGSSSLAESARRRLALWDISGAQIDDILRSGTVKRRLTLFSPASGVVTVKQVQEGQAVQSGQLLYTITDLSVVWVEAEVREADAGLMRQGSPVSLEFAAYPGRREAGTVNYVYQTLEPQARTLKVRIVVANRDQRLKPGMYATVRVTTPPSTALAVPTSAVLRTGERALVFVDVGEGRLMPRDVELGRTGERDTEIRAGLQAGDRVVTSAQYLLDSEANLGEVMKSMIGQTGGH